MILTVCALYSFLGNSALLGPSVYIAIYAEEFGITQNTASGLISYANLAFGFGVCPGITCSPNTPSSRVVVVVVNTLSS